MNQTFLTCLFVIGCLIKTVAQSVTIEGAVLNKITRLPVENATVQSGKTHCLTNSKGVFTLVADMQDISKKGITCTSVGYHNNTTYYKSKPEGNIVIELIEKANHLPGVIVKDGRGVVQRAIDCIPLNYPTRPFIMNGIVRLRRNQDNGYTYANDAYVSVYNWPYTQQKKAEVKLVANKATTITGPGFDSGTTRRWVHAYQTAAVADFVNNRIDVISASRMKKFNYVLKEKERYGQRKAYVIDCYSKEGAGGSVYEKLECTLYIDTATYAFIAGKFAVDHIERTGFAHIDKLEETVEYTNEWGKWCLKRVWANAFYAGYLKVHSDGFQEYLTTSIDTVNVKPFSYEEVLQKMDVVQHINKPVDSTEWSRYAALFAAAEARNEISPTVLPPVDTIQVQSQRYRHKHVNILAKAMLYLPGNVMTVYGITRLPVTVRSPAKGIAAYALGMRLGIRAYRNAYIFLDSYSNYNVGKLSASYTTYGVLTDIKLNKKGVPFYVTPYAGYSRMKLSYSNEEKVKKECGLHALSGGLGISRELTHRWRLYTGISYQHFLNEDKLPAVMPVSVDKLSYTLGMFYKL